jgi:hypothetical protein
VEGKEDEKQRRKERKKEGRQRIMHKKLVYN